MAWNLFKFFYSSSFSIIAFFTGILLLLTPADAVHQALKNGQVYNIFIISGFYLLTAVLSLILYFYRLYSFRSTLNDIPKYYLPVKKGDLSARGYRVVKAELGRSAIVAWESKPRGIPLAPADVAPALPQQQHGRRHGHHTSPIIPQFSHGSPVSGGDGLVRAETFGSAGGSLPWGTISHPDHSPGVLDAYSASTRIPPDTHYPSVIATLPTIISTRAALVHPALSMPKHGSSMRSYLFGVLVDVGLVEDVLAEAFIAAYERARFSDGSVTAEEFVALMQMMASMLRGIEAVQGGPNGNGNGNGNASGSMAATSSAADVISSVSPVGNQRGMSHQWLRGLAVDMGDAGMDPLQRINTQASTMSYVTTTDTITTVSTDQTTRRRSLRREASYASAASRSTRSLASA